MAPMAGDVTLIRFYLPPEQRLLIGHEILGPTVSRRIFSPLSDAPCVWT
jgi:hypothetical protein